MTKTTNYRYLTREEEETAIISIMEVLLDDSLPFSGEHRKKQWEKGWGQNLKEGNSVPKYFAKHPINRLDGRFILPDDSGYEVNELHNLVYGLTLAHFRDFQDVYEFGCGTGHNLDVVAKVGPAILHGFDWTKASQKILRKRGIHAENFDFFHPNYSIKLAKDAGVLTVAALEQTGTDYKKFVNYLIRNKPSIVVHIEPIPELLDSSNLLDYLSIKYMQKRKYLSGYLDYLRKLEDKGQIEILVAQRSGIGSFLIDGYSIIVWKPSRG